MTDPQEDWPHDPKVPDFDGDDDLGRGIRREVVELLSKWAGDPAQSLYVAEYLSRLIYARRRAEAALRHSEGLNPPRPSETH